MSTPEAVPSPRTPPLPPDPSRVRRRRAVVAAVVVALLSLVGGLAVWVQRDLNAVEAKEKDCCWHQGITPEWLSDRIGIRIPAGATDRRAGYRTGLRWDNGVLAFTLPDARARSYLARLVPGDERMVENVRPLEKYERPDTFARIGLPDPETIREGVLKSGFCPDGLDTVEGRHLRTCADVISHAYEPGSTRIYVRAKFEPGQSPLPSAAPSG
ncbi:hypothetical protein ACWD4V_11385 [Streptomyces tsukubensis]|uniref:hypothetical protein n=1 Tax=Streptomyces tsukubensis TaxID=83656 RepID=UPI00369DCD6B